MEVKELCDVIEKAIIRLCLPKEVSVNRLRQISEADVIDSIKLHNPGVFEYFTEQEVFNYVVSTLESMIDKIAISGKLYEKEAVNEYFKDKPYTVE